MFLVTYSVENTSGWIQKSLEFVEEKDAEDFKASKTASSSYKNAQIWTSKGQENLNYKVMFEELYNHVLTGAGVRNVSVGKKAVETI